MKKTVDRIVVLDEENVAVVAIRNQDSTGKDWDLSVEMVPVGFVELAGFFERLSTDQLRRALEKTRKVARFGLDGILFSTPSVVVYSQAIPPETQIISVVWKAPKSNAWKLARVVALSASDFGSRMNALSDFLEANL